MGIRRRSTLRRTALISTSPDSSEAVLVFWMKLYALSRCEFFVTSGADGVSAVSEIDDFSTVDAILCH